MMRRILSLDGGGIRGLIPALVLADIERKTGKMTAELFDLIAGTSTGGILALGVNRVGADGKPRYSAAQLALIYKKRGKDIFARSFWKGVSSVAGLADELYDSDGIEAVLNEYFGTDLLPSCHTKTMVTTYDIEKREPLFLKSWHEEQTTVQMKHAARATSAAPTYFEPAYIEVNGKNRALVDGGVFINSPSVSAYAEAIRLWPEERDFMLLSLGTGEHTRPIPFHDAKDWGKVAWLQPLLSCMFDGVSDAVDYQMNMLLGESYLRLQTNLDTASDDMDNASAGNIANLEYEAKMLLRKHRNVIDSLCKGF